MAIPMRTTNEDEDARIVGLGEILEIDPSLSELADLPYGWQAWRENASAPWQRFVNDREEE